MDELTKYMSEEATYFIDTFPLMRHSSMGVLDGNPVHYACLNEIVKIETFKDTPMREYVLNQARERCVKIYEHVKLEPGLINRGPHKFFDRQSHDDYVLLCCLAAIVGEHWIGKEILEHGRNNFYMWNNTSDRSIRVLWSCFFPRIPGVFAALKLGAGEKLTSLDSLMVYFGIHSTIFRSKDSTSGRIMDFALVKALEWNPQEPRLIESSIQAFKNSISNLYENKMGDIFGIYFSPKHLFSVWMQGKM